MDNSYGFSRIQIGPLLMLAVEGSRSPPQALFWSILPKSHLTGDQTTNQHRRHVQQLQSVQQLQHVQHVQQCQHGRNKLTRLL